MGQHHDHSHHHHSNERDRATHNLLLALVLNLGFACIEFVGGMLTNSVAILSDALHDFGDAFSLGFAWYLQKIAGKPRDEYYSYGYRRFSLLGALVVSSVLLIGVALVIRESIERLMRPEPADAKGMLYLALLGVAINGFAALQVKKGASLNERAVYLHLLEDVLGWVAVLFGSVAMLFFKLPWLDPVLSLGIAAFILFNVFCNLHKVVRILLMEVPGQVKLPEFEAQVRAIKEVQDIDDLHVWTLDGQNHVLTMQVIVSDRLSFRALRTIKQKIRKLAQAQGIGHSTIEFCCHGEDRQQHH
jgi:cobalt-zinc-cadmium efflux system protein